MPFAKWLCRKLLSNRTDYELLSGRLTDINDRLNKLEALSSSQVPLVIQHADKVVIEKVDFSNHFGTLDIESLEGRLNIGFNAFGALKTDRLCCSTAANKPCKQEPKYNIRARKKDDHSSSHKDQLG